MFNPQSIIPTLETAVQPLCDNLQHRKPAVNCHTSPVAAQSDLVKSLIYVTSSKGMEYCFRIYLGTEQPSPQGGEWYVHIRPFISVKTSQNYFECFIFSDTLSYSPMHILWELGMNAFVTSIHAMIRDIRLQWCQWCIFDLWRTEISS
jgi:hypothetical protein